MVQVQEARACADQLTPRETEVLMYVSQGLLNKQIAFEMSISEIMVKLHRGRMMKKMKARSVVEVVRKFDQVHMANEIVAA
jgi:FixJ family two-component response regulator